MYFFIEKRSTFMCCVFVTPPALLHNEQNAAVCDATGAKYQYNSLVHKSYSTLLVKFQQPVTRINFAKRKSGLKVPLRKFLFMRALLVLFTFVILFFSCTPNNVNVDDSLGKFFTENKAQGTFALLNNASGEFTVYNLSRYRDSLYLPASTFKIVNSLIGLQMGVITNDSMVIKWDGVPRRMEQWNKDLTMYEAFRVSAVPYYQEVARRIGKDTMQRWLDTLSYGTKKITSRIDTFWLDNTLKIRPDEQMGLVKQLYFNQLPFHKINQEMVKRAMLFEDKPEYKLSYKTGWGVINHPTHKNIGWIVGWIEENKHPYFFVLNLESADPNFDMITARMNILKGILKHLGFMEGKR